MSLPRHIFAPAFRHQKLSWFFAALVGVMVYVATFAMAAEATLSAMTVTWDKGMETRMTIEIPAVDDESGRPQADRIQQTIAVLRAMPDIVSIRAVPEDETLTLLKPWISQPELLKALPIPALIDIERKDGSQLTVADIQNHLKTVVEDVRVDDHAAWVANISHLVSGLSIMAALMIILTAITLVIAVSLICRAIMATERETISLLHTIGAEDRDIARHFQFHAKRLATPASWIGFALALASTAVLLFFLRNMADASLLQPLHWVILLVTTLVVPLAAITIAALAARVSTLKLLYTMP